jgi:acyl-coenzyme A thioesterase PaaI-like protein
MKKSLQQTYAPQSICYGCGPANNNGLRIESFVEGDRIIAHWRPQPYHHAFPNVLNGGIIGALLDCHCNWAAAWYLMQAQGLDQAPCTVTAEYTIKLLRPTPMDTELTLIATLESIDKSRVTINGQLIARDKICDTCRGVFVAVKDDHPAHHRW